MGDRKLQRKAQFSQQPKNEIPKFFWISKVHVSLKNKILFVMNKLIFKLVRNELNKCALVDFVFRLLSYMNLITLYFPYGKIKVELVYLIG